MFVKSKQLHQPSCFHHFIIKQKMHTLWFVWLLLNCFDYTTTVLRSSNKKRLEWKVMITKVKRTKGFFCMMFLFNVRYLLFQIRIGCLKSEINEFDNWAEEEGIAQMSTLLNDNNWYLVKVSTKGEGVKNTPNFVYVVCTRSHACRAQRSEELYILYWVRCYWEALKNFSAQGSAHWNYWNLCWN